jgi:Leucine-rich repeat (LRR) protein
MNTRTILSVALATLFLSISFCGKKDTPTGNASENAYLADTAIVRAILDTNGITNVGIIKVARLETRNSLYRVVNLKLIRDSLQGGIISFIPSSIGNLGALEILTLENDSIPVLPAELGTLTNLTTLSIKTCKIGSLPSTIGNCVALTHIYAQGNVLTTLPSTIGSLASLSLLDLTSNMIASLPDQITSLSCDLFIDGNKLCSPDVTVSASIQTWLDGHSSGWRNTQICP